MEWTAVMYGYIYLIVNKVNGKTYVGQHKSNSFNDNYMGSGTVLHRAFNKYGKENFEKFHLQSCWSKEELDKQEIFWIAEYKKRCKAEYNLTKGGTGGNGGANKGQKRSEEIKAKFREADKLYDHHLTNEQKEQISNKLKGRPAWNKGKKMPVGWNTNRKPYKHTDSWKAKIHESKLGHTVDEETRRKISETLKGKHWYTNGETNIMSDKCPDGFWKGRTINE